MKEVYIKEQKFEKIDFSINQFKKGEYESCTFHECDLSNLNLSEVKFLACKFEGCNISMANLTQATVMDVKFKDCKMLGLLFENCNPFGLSFTFECCNLSHCSFFRTKIKKTVFKNSEINEADFTESDLTNAIFDNCDLTGATFENAILEKVDFSTSFNYSINPEINRIKKAKFSLVGIRGLLAKYDIEID